MPAQSLMLALLIVARIITEARFFGNVLRLMSMHPFFVYGTLLPDQPNYELWGGAIVKSEPATLQGATLYDMGSFPVAGRQQLEGTIGFVVGQSRRMFSLICTRKRCNAWMHSNNTIRNIREHSAYRRVQRSVVTKEDIEELAWVYVGNLRLSVGCL